MIPWTEEFFAQSSYSFQLVSARLASLLLIAMGFPVFREATVLQLPGVSFEVASECSGLGFLYSTIALSVPLVYLTQRTWWRAAGVLVFGAAIPILANGVRVALVGAIGYYGGEFTLRGPLHIFEGWFVAQGGILFLFLINWAVTKLPCASPVKLHERWKGLTADVVPTTPVSRTAGLPALLMLPILGFAYTYGWYAAQVGILFLFLVCWAVAKLLRASPVKLHERWKALTADVAPTNSVSRTAGSSVLLILSLLGFGFYLHFFSPPHPVPPRRSLAELPQVIDRWQAQHSAWIEGSRFFPGATAETIRAYHTIAGKEVFLYIGYFASQRTGMSLSSKLSEPIRRDVHELPLRKPIAGLQRVNHSMPTIDGKRYEAMFWYHLPSGNTTGRYETKLRQFLDAVIRGHNNGAVVLLATPASEKQDGAAVDDLLEFATVMAPVLEEYLP
jgi:EpsI family protein